MIHILLVEGHPFIRKMLKSQIENDPELRIAGEAENAAAAFEQAQSVHPDLIILDYDNPDGGGMALIRRFHEILPLLPIIVLCLSDDEDLRARILALGAAEFITKEGSSDSILAAIYRTRHLSGS